MRVGSEKIKLVIDSNLDHVGLIGMTVNAVCSSLELSDPIPHDMELCVVEAVNNCIVHAYDNKAGEEIEVILDLASERLTFRIRDKGRTMEPVLRCINRPEFDPLDLSTLPENGMGLYIIQKIMDDVAYERSGGINILTMSKQYK